MTENTINMYADINLDGKHGGQHITVLEVASKLKAKRINVQETLYYRENNRTNKFVPDIVADGQIIEILALHPSCQGEQKFVDKVLYVFVPQRGVKKEDIIILDNYDQLMKKWRELLK